MGPKKKKANKAREEYLEKKKLEREEAAAAKAQQGEGQGGQGDQVRLEKLTCSLLIKSLLKYMLETGIHAVCFIRDTL